MTSPSLQQGLPTILDTSTQAIVDPKAIELLHDWEVGHIQNEVLRLISLAISIVEDEDAEDSDEPDYFIAQTASLGDVEVTVEYGSTDKLKDGSEPCQARVSMPLYVFTEMGDWDSFISNLLDCPMHKDFARWVLGHCKQYKDAEKDGGEDITVYFEVQNKETPVYDEDEIANPGFSLSVWAESDVIEDSLLGEEGTDMMIAEHGIYRESHFDDAFPDLPQFPEDISQMPHREVLQLNSSMDDLNNPIRAELLKILFQVLESVT